MRLVARRVGMSEVCPSSTAPDVPAVVRRDVLKLATADATRSFAVLNSQKHGVLHLGGERHLFGAILRVRLEISPDRDIGDRGDR
jgi:hypothetical protein